MGPRQSVRSDLPDVLCGRGVVALMIGELKYQPVLNSITTAIVSAAVDRWQAGARGGVLVCESPPMSTLARELGVPAECVWTADPRPAGHTTRAVAKAIESVPALRLQRWHVITHCLHAKRASAIFANVGLVCEFEGLDLPFNRSDPDWKLTSSLMFRLYNVAASVHGFFGSMYFPRSDRSLRKDQGVNGDSSKHAGTRRP